MAILLGAHVESDHPIQRGAERGAEVVQINLSAPVMWRSPKERLDAEVLRTNALPIYVHAPYLLNAASINPELRAKTKNALQVQTDAAYAIGARGVVVHGGHPTGAGVINDAVNGWLEVMDGWEPKVPVLVENTAGGSSGPARHLAGLEQLWKAFERAGLNGIGYVLDTCHAHSATNKSLAGIAQRTIEIVGRIDLIHANDSEDPAGSGRDHHVNLGTGIINPEHFGEIINTAQCHVVVETPGGAEAQRRDIAWLRELLR